MDELDVGQVPEIREGLRITEMRPIGVSANFPIKPALRDPIPPDLLRLTGEPGKLVSDAARQTVCSGIELLSMASPMVEQGHEYIARIAAHAQVLRFGEIRKPV